METKFSAEIEPEDWVLLSYSGAFSSSAIGISSLDEVFMSVCGSC